jgi:hypothetical protein
MIIVKYVGQKTLTEPPNPTANLDIGHGVNFSDVPPTNSDGFLYYYIMNRLPTRTGHQPKKLRPIVPK